MQFKEIINLASIHMASKVPFYGLNMSNIVLICYIWMTTSNIPPRFEEISQLQEQYLASFVICQYVGPLAANPPLITDRSGYAGSFSCLLYELIMKFL